MIFINNKIVSTYESSIWTDNKLWFTEISCNEFYCYDLLTHQVKLICELKDEDKYGKRLFGSLVKYDNYMYLIPYAANNIYRVELETGNVKSIEFDTLQIQGKSVEKSKWLSAHLYQHKIYMMPMSYPAIVELDCITEEIKYYDNWIQDVKNKYKISGNIFFRKTILVDNIIYAPLCDANGVVKFDINTKEVSILEVGSRAKGYSSICYDGTHFWLSPRGRGAVVKWNEKYGSWTEYNDYMIENQETEGYFADIINLQDGVLLLPLYGVKAYFFSRVTGDASIFDFNDKKLGLMCVNMMADKVLFFSAMSGNLFVYGRDGELIQRCKIYFTKEIESRHNLFKLESYRILKKIKPSQNIFVNEEYQDALRDYIHYIDMNDN